MNPVILEVVTPEKKVLREEVESIIAPGTEGYLGVLPRHSPLLTTLKPGVVQYRKAGKWEQLAVSGGFMEAGPRRVVILADAAELPSEIDIERARCSMERAKKRLWECPPGLDVARAEAALMRSLARLKAAGSKE
ncbi:MAG: F0F1 ATP synthase subunit epsilon [Dethiobacteria bacterium]|jgi:F-type H+-transporting ATPase subunit epsilon|nr:F0F1 ATP synthase subunit epsilon [Bacillota bacterium]HOL16102.1 F0F1 ATP synthase subunit epsilon [Bacillota bacterium]